MGVKEIMPPLLAGGLATWAAFLWDFVWYGMLGVKFDQRLYTAEPIGVWYYTQVAGYFQRRFDRSFAKHGRAKTESATTRPLSTTVDLMNSRLRYCKFGPD